MKPIKRGKFAFLGMNINTKIIEKELKWISHGNQKSVVLKILEYNDFLAPVQIWKRVRVLGYKISRNYVSDILREFKKRGYITYKFNEKNERRLYKLTRFGEEIKDKFVSNPNKGLGYEFKKWRLKRGATQLEIAEKANINPRFYRSIENGKVDTIIFDILKIADALEIRLNQLVGVN